MLMLVLTVPPADEAGKYSLEHVARGSLEGATRRRTNWQQRKPE
jgi:hypothetical protein